MKEKEVLACRKQYIHGLGSSGGVEGRGCGATTGICPSGDGCCHVGSSCSTAGIAAGIA